MVGEFQVQKSPGNRGPLAEQCKRPHQTAQVKKHRFLMGSGIRTDLSRMGAAFDPLRSLESKESRH